MAKHLLANHLVVHGLQLKNLAQCFDCCKLLSEHEGLREHRRAAGHSSGRRRDRGESVLFCLFFFP